MSIWDIFSLFGGLGLFLYGMKLMSDGLEAAAGNRLRRWLEVLTKNRFAGLAVGTGVTAVIQSSSATTVMVVGFVNAGLMSLSQAIGVCMGANIGTTITSQLLAFELSDIAPIILFLGIIMIMFIKNRTVQKIGQIVAGFGILFMGMSLMSSAMEPLKNWQPFIDLLAHFSNPLIGVLAGMLVTAIIQSSSATMGMLLALASSGIVTLDNSMYVILGLNIGTCITAVLASLGANKTAKRTAVVHVLFNLFGTALFLILINVLPLETWIRNLSPGDVERQLANFHTIFNVVTTAILIWFPGLLIKLSSLIVRGEDKKAQQMQLKYLISATMDNPPVAVGLAIKEVGRMGQIAMQNFEYAMDGLISNDGSIMPHVKEQEAVVNYLDREITNFLANLSQEELSSSDSNIITSLFHLVMDIERISDHAENVAEFTDYFVENKITLSSAGKEEITLMISRVRDALEKAIHALNTGDMQAADEVIEIEKEVDELEIRLKNNHVERLANGTCNTRSSMIYTDLVTNLERVADHSTNIAYRVLKDGIYK